LFTVWITKLFDLLFSKANVYYPFDQQRAVQQVLRSRHLLNAPRQWCTSDHAIVDLLPVVCVPLLHDYYKYGGPQQQ